MILAWRVEVIKITPPRTFSTLQLIINNVFFSYLYIFILKCEKKRHNNYLGVFSVHTQNSRIIFVQKLQFKARYAWIMELMVAKDINAIIVWHHNHKCDPDSEQVTDRLFENNSSYY